jgi:SAM-dependent methyltransferase
MMDDFVLGRYRLMRLFLSEIGLHDKVLLDIGAGGNPISMGLKCKQTITVDIRADAAPSLVCNFIDGIPLSDNSVDVAIAGEILEHLTDARRFLREVRRVLRSDGYLLLSVPNIVSLKYRFAFLCGHIPALAAKADYTYLPDNPAYPRGHVRDYSFREVRKVLWDQGFRVIAERSVGVHFKGRRVVPPWLIPTSFSDSVVVKALLSK